MKKDFTIEQIAEVTGHFRVNGSLQSFARYGSGHINDTFRITCGEEYILQRINTEIFTDPVSLMNNIEGVTDFLRNKIIINGGNPDRETLNLVHTCDGASFYRDAEGDCWRIYLFIKNAISYQQVMREEDFCESGRAFGHFQNLLADYPADQLTESLPHFHDFKKRYQDFLTAVREDAVHKVCTAENEIALVNEMAKDCLSAQEELNKHVLPLRVTHNDTKLNNIMMDPKTGKAVCIIDLDTVMPGYSIFDFGDAIRFGANRATEDERDLSAVSLSRTLFTAFTDGYLAGCDGSLTEKETEMLPMGARMMTLECGMRFLADYLSGDTYFKISRDRQNLDRCRTQLALVSDMDIKWDEMHEIVRSALALSKG